MSESTPNPPKLESSSRYLDARSRYHGKFTPANLVFNANLQEFAQKLGYLWALETSDKISPSAAYKQVKQLWDQCDLSKQELDSTEDTSRPEK